MYFLHFIPIEGVNSEKFNKPNIIVIILVLWCAGIQQDITINARRCLSSDYTSRECSLVFPIRDVCGILANYSSKCNLLS